MNKNLIIILTIAFFAFNNNELNAQKTQTQILENIAEEVNQDSLMNYVTRLQNCGTRFALAENRKEVAEWIKNKFISFGYNHVVLDSFQLSAYGTETWQYNVICRSENPDNHTNYTLIGAHHDAITYNNPADTAPGADDNASGVAGVLETARILKTYEEDTQIPFHFATWAAEELGLHGSNYYVEKYNALDSLPEFYFNLDMIGNDEGNSMKFNYEVDPELFSMVDITPAYTNLSPVSGSSTGGSDHMPFRTENVPIIYFYEHNFSDVYHSESDVAANLEPDYLAEMVRGIAVSMYYGANSNPAPQVEKIANGGHGDDFYMTWENQENVAYFQINVSHDDQQVYSQTTTSDSIHVDGLPANANICIELFSVANDSIPGFSYRNCIELTATPQPLELSSNMHLTNIALKWSDKLPLDADSIVIQRKKETDENWETMDQIPALVKQYDITDHAQGIWTYKTILKDTDGNASEPSTIKIYSTANKNDIMTVIGNLGAYGNPSSETIGAFYDSIMPEKDHFIFNAVTQYKYLNLMQNMEVVIWNSFTANNSQFYKRIDILNKYISDGGKLLVFANELYRHTNPDLSVDEQFNQGQMIYKMGIKNALYEEEALLKQIKHADGTTANVNPAKVPDVYDGALPGIEALVPHENAEVVLTYHSLIDSAPANSLDGNAIAVKATSDSSTIISCSVPLYYFETDQAPNILKTLLEDEMAVGIEPTLKNEEKIGIYPNPADNYIFIHNRQNTSNEGLLTIYDLSGRPVHTKHIKINGRGKKLLNTQNLSKGIYIVRLKGSVNYSTKLIIDR